MSVRKSGRQQLKDEFLEVGGENVVKMHAGDRALFQRKVRKIMFLGKNMEKSVFGAFLTDDVSLTS